MEAIGKDYVHHRVEDWAERISDLYDYVESQASGEQGLRFDRSQHTTMYEELMDKYDYGPKKMPVLDIYRKNKLLATFQPIGLWVIGANGRVDVLTKDGAHILADLSDEGEPPQWMVFSPRSKKGGKPLDENFVREILLES
jgi:hypothetical protein